MCHEALMSSIFLYEIFLHLPQQDLLLIQRVCGQWRDVITSREVLLAALFLRPGPTASEAVDAPNQLNPLLQSRFPSFFDTTVHYANDPLRNTHWAENIRPWLQWCPSIPLCDKRAAYKRPEASWRRMIPCMPAPVELQVSYGYYPYKPRDNLKYTLRCLAFSNEDSHDSDHASPSAPKDGTFERPPWLTFGLVYDIVETGWFRGRPKPVYDVHFDFTFQDARPDVTVPPHEISQEKHETIRRYGRRENLRDILPHKKIGGVGRVLIFLIGVHTDTAKEKWYKDLFELGHTTMDWLEWDEEIEYGSDEKV